MIINFLLTTKTLSEKQLDIGYGTHWVYYLYALMVMDLGHGYICICAVAFDSQTSQVLAWNSLYRVA